MEKEIDEPSKGLHNMTTPTPLPAGTSPSEFTPASGAVLQL
jgi:hypothetical protein